MGTPALGTCLEPHLYRLRKLLLPGNKYSVRSRKRWREQSLLAVEMMTNGLMQAGVPHATWSWLELVEWLGEGARWRPFSWKRVIQFPKRRINGCFKWMFASDADRVFPSCHQLDSLTNIRLHHSFLFQVDELRFPRSVEAFSPNGGNELNHWTPACRSHVLDEKRCCP